MLSLGSGGGFTQVRCEKSQCREQIGAKGNVTIPTKAKYLLSDGRGIGKMSVCAALCELFSPGEKEGSLQLQMQRKSFWLRKSLIPQRVILLLFG